MALPLWNHNPNFHIYRHFPDAFLHTLSMVSRFLIDGMVESYNLY
jgi:hypothetical protein